MPCWMREVSSVNAESSSVNRKLPRMNCLISCRRPMWFHCPVQADWMMPFDPHATHPGPVRVLHVGFVTGGLCLLLHRSEEHTSELQSLMRISYAVFCLKTKNQNKILN